MGFDKHAFMQRHKYQPARPVYQERLESLGGFIASQTVKKPGDSILTGNSVVRLAETKIEGSENMEDGPVIEKRSDSVSMPKTKSVRIEPRTGRKERKVLRGPAEPSVKA